MSVKEAEAVVAKQEAINGLSRLPLIQEINVPQPQARKGSRATPFFPYRANSIQAASSALPVSWHRAARTRRTPLIAR
jgi:hypothetical protein